MELQIVKTAEQRNAFANIINTCHSYINHKQTPTRRVNYLIWHNTSIIGAIGINSPALNLKCRDALFDADNTTKILLLNHFCNNYRFCLMDWRLKELGLENAGTMALKQLRIQAAQDWYAKYGFELLGMETFVDTSKTGAVYKADNWNKIGETSGWSASRLPIKLLQTQGVSERKITEYKEKHHKGYNKTNPKHVFFKKLYKEKFFQQKLDLYRQKYQSNVVKNQIGGKVNPTAIAIRVINKMRREKWRLNFDTNTKPKYQNKETNINNNHGRPCRLQKL